MYSAMKEIATDSRRTAVSSRSRVSSTARGSFVPAAVQVASRVDLILVNYLKQVIEAKLPNHYSVEGHPEPSNQCRMVASKLVDEFYRLYELTPSRIGASLVGGIMIVYKNSNSKLDLELEVDNDCDISGVVSSSTEVIESICTNQFSELRQVVRKHRI